MRIYVLASGSDGNATVFESNGSRVLVDGGIGPQALVQRLVDLGAGGMPDAILVTHAHQDHVGQTARIGKEAPDPGLRIGGHRGAGAARRSIPGPALFTRRALRGRRLDDRADPNPARRGASGVSDQRRRTGSAGIATDLGEVTSDLVDHFKSCDAVLVESNHDVGLLRTGALPRVSQAAGRVGARAPLERADPRALAAPLVRDAGRRAHAPRAPTTRPRSRSRSRAMRSPAAG